MIVENRLCVHYHVGVNVLRWCPFLHLFDTLFQNSPYGHVLNHPVILGLKTTTIYIFKSVG